MLKNVGRSVSAITQSVRNLATPSQFEIMRKHTARVTSGRKWIPKLVVGSQYFYVIHSSLEKASFNAHEADWIRWMLSKAIEAMTGPAVVSTVKIEPPGVRDKVSGRWYQIQAYSSLLKKNWFDEYEPFPFTPDGLSEARRQIEKCVNHDPLFDRYRIVVRSEEILEVATK